MATGKHYSQGQQYYRIKFLRKSTIESADDVAAADNDDVDEEDDYGDEVHGGRLLLKNWQTFNLSSLVVVHTC